MTSNFVEIPVEGKPMRAFVARPEGQGPHAGVMVLQEAFGVNRHIRDITSRVAALGYVAIAPELFHRTAPPGFEGKYGDFDSIKPHYEGVTMEALEADLKATHRWLCSQADPNRTAAIGFCMGGRASFVANSLLPLKAAVSFYGGRIAPDLLPRAKNQSGPIALFWGGKDAHIGPEQQRQVADALRAAKKPFVDVEFSEADHGFLCDDRPSYHPAAARQAWAMVVEFLKEQLKA